MSHVLEHRDASSPTGVILYANAALEGATAASLTGYSYCRFWPSAIADLGLEFMLIILLKFAAYGTDAILAIGYAGDGARVAIYTDPLRFAGVLYGDLPATLIMRVVHSEIVTLPEFCALDRLLLPLSGSLPGIRRFVDLALCAALSVVPRRAALNEAAIGFAARVHQRSLSAIESGCTTTHGQIMASWFTHSSPPCCARARALLATLVALPPSPCSALVPVSSGARAAAGHSRR